MLTGFSDLLGFRPPPDFKWIKTTLLPRFPSLLEFQAPLISKGLRLRSLDHQQMFVFQAPPDFKGIKTPETGVGSTGKTSFQAPLISKGLNPAAAAALAAGLGKCCVNEEKAVSGFRCQCFGFGWKLFAGNLGL